LIVFSKNEQAAGELCVIVEVVKAVVVAVAVVIEVRLWPTV